MATLAKGIRSGRSGIHNHGSDSGSVLEGNDTVRVFSNVKHGVHVALGAGSRQHLVSACTVGATSVGVSFHQRGEQVTNLFHSTDFVFPSRRATVVFHVLEVGHITNVGFTVGVADGHERRSDVFRVEVRGRTHDAGDTTSTLILQLTHDAALESKRDGRVHIRTSSAVSVFHVGTAEHHSETQTFNHFSSLFTDDFRSVPQGFAVACINQHVGQGHERTVLVERGSDVGGGQRLRGRRNTFSQCGGGSRQSFVTTELDVLGVTFRQGISLTELFKHEEGESTGQELENSVRIKHGRHSASGLPVSDNCAASSIHSHCI